MQPTNSCQPETIFNSPGCDVQFCPDCQMMHLNMGALTLRITEQQFANYAIDISKAMFSLRQHEAGDYNMRVMN